MTSKFNVDDRECPVKKYNETKGVSGIYRFYAIDPKMVLATVTVNYCGTLEGVDFCVHNRFYSAA